MTFWAVPGLHRCPHRARPVACGARRPAPTHQTAPAQQTAEGSFCGSRDGESPFPTKLSGKAARPEAPRHLPAPTPSAAAGGPQQCVGRVSHAGAVGQPPRGESDRKSRRSWPAVPSLAALFQISRTFLQRWHEVFLTVFRGCLCTATLTPLGLSPAALLGLSRCFYVPRVVCVAPSFSDRLVTCTNRAEMDR